MGQAVKALVPTGLGLVQQRLYWTAQFFEKMPTNRLIGEGVRPEHLNDDVLGPALDDLYNYGVTEIFRDLAAHAVEQLGLNSRFARLDTTTFSFEDEYDSDDSSEDRVIRVQQGYSRDNSQDQNQAVLDMIVERKTGLPILMKPLSGYVSDPGNFPELIDRHVDHLQNTHGFDYVVADSALYSADHVEKLTENGVKFVTRAPQTTNEAKTRTQEAEIDSMEPHTECYRDKARRSEYGDTEQRWLTVYSEEAEEQVPEYGRDQVRREPEKEKKASSSLLIGSSRAEKTPSRPSKSSSSVSKRAS